MADRLREDRLAEEEKRRPFDDGPEMPLKNGGGSMQLGVALDWAEALRSLLEKDPEHFRALWALVDGRKSEVSEQQTLDLKRQFFLGQDDNPLPSVRAVMTAAVRDTPDGPCLVDPLEVRSDEDAAAVQRYEEELARRRQKGADYLRRKLFGDESGNDRGRSP
jgi:hypothetical protein